MGGRLLPWLMAIVVTSQCVKFEEDADFAKSIEDPKDNFFRQLRAYPIDPEAYAESLENPLRERRKSAPQAYDIPKPGGLQITERGKRSVHYHVLPSPGLKSHFQQDKKRNKRDTSSVTESQIKEAENVESSSVLKRDVETPKFDLQFIQGTNKDVISQNYAKSVVEEVTRTAAIAGHLPGYELKFFQGTSTGNAESTTSTTAPSSSSSIIPPIERLEKEGQLEITLLDKDDIESKNLSELPVVTTPPKENAEGPAINDFIRFRRNSIHPEASAQGSEMIKAEARYIDNVPDESMVDEHMIPLQVRVEDDRMRLKRDKIQQRSGKMLLASGEPLPDTNREPRGATKEQWVKQPYPVQNPNNKQQQQNNRYDDSSASPSEVRPPRVDFITHKWREYAPEPKYMYYEREGRMADYAGRELPRENPRDLDRDNYRSPKYYSPPRRYYPTRNRYYDEEPAEGRYVRNRYEHTRSYDSPRNYDRPVYNKPKRIIYYATLPEVVRDYNNRGRYDDRYAPRPLSDAYNQRKPYPGKSRYEETDRTKPRYPLKVSTDISVSEIKKNPERKIYAETDRRYGFKSPTYRHDDIYDRRP